jgi:glutathione transport system permease protein
MSKDIVLTQKKTPFSIFRHKLKQRKTAMIAGVFIVLLVLVAIFSPLVAPHDPFKTDYSMSMMPPSFEHPAGTDLYGRDILSRIIYGARISLAVGFTSVLVGALAGVTLGIISGFFGGFLDGAPSFIAFVE